MNPYLAAVLIGLALGLAYCGIQILCIHIGFVLRRRARRAEWERERPYREAIRAHDNAVSDAQFAYRHIESIKRLHRQGILTDDRLAHMIGPAETELESAATRLHQAREALEQQIARACQ